MKFHLFVLSLICLSFIACKKERTCACDIETSGVRATHSQNAGVAITLPILPAVTISPSKDTTFSTPFKYFDKNKTSYGKISKRTLKKSCQPTFEEEDIQRYSSVVPGSYTVDVTETITKKYTCEIE